MNKTVGIFEGVVNPAYPAKCEIWVGDYSIMFTHKSLADLKHLVSEMEKAARKELPICYKDEI